jgi:DNA polymerase-3 subunit beta
MKIRIPRQDLLDTVNKVKTVVSPKSALPILSHVLFEAKDSVLKLSATDLKVSIECTVDCTVDEPGSLTVSSQRLSMVISELPNEEITLELGESNVILLSCGKIQTKLFSMAPEEFPPIRSFENIEPLTLPQPMLRKMFGRTSFAICSDQARYNLTGLLLELSDGKLTAVATDGRRMSLCMESEGIPEGIRLKMIVPGKMIGELERLLGGDGTVDVYFDETQAAFSFGSVRLVTALIEGNFPNYEVVVPKKHDKEAVINVMRFTEGIRRTRTMTNEKFNSVRFTLETGNLMLRVVTPEVGEYHEETPIEYDGEKVEIAFNPDFLLDVLKHIDSEMVCLVFKDSMSPGVLKPFTEAPQDSYVNVIMPIRL